MKYIATKQSDGTEEIFLFPKSVNHDAMAEILPYIKDQTHGDWSRVYREPISAGFVDYEGTCFGKSETLNLESRGGVDTQLLVQSH